MKRWISAGLALLMTVGLLAGCSKNEKEPSAQKNSSDAGDPPQTSSGSAPDGPAGLVLYSPLPQDVVDAAVAGFEESTGVRVTVVCDSADALVQRIASPKAGEPAADVLFGAGAELVEQYAVYFKNYQSPESSAIAAEFQDGNNLWTALSPMPLVIMYSKTQTTKAPEGWATLVGEAYGGWVAFTDPERSGTSYTSLFAMAQAMGSGAADYGFVDLFAKNLEGKLLDSIADVYAGVEAGDFAAGVTLESSAQKYLDAGYDEKVGYIFPSEGTMAALEVSAVTAKAANAETAGDFIDYVSSEEFQRTLAEQFRMRSVRSDAPAPGGYTELEEIKLIPYSPKSAVSSRQETLSRFSEAYREGAAASEAEPSSQAAA